MVLLPGWDTAACSLPRPIPEDDTVSVDKVAQAICEVTTAGKLFPWDELSEAARDSWRVMAVAAITAMSDTDKGEQP